MGQQNLAKSAEQAKKELEKAQQEQKQGKGESAEEHLKKALNALGAKPMDLISILQAMKAAGALRADLEII